MKNTQFSLRFGLRLPREEQMKRVRRVMAEELTELQRYTLEQYYFRHKTLARIAEERGVCKSTVLRTLRRAEEKLRQCLKY